MLSLKDYQEHPAASSSRSSALWPFCSEKVSGLPPGPSCQLTVQSLLFYWPALFTGISSAAFESWLWCQAEFPSQRPRSTL